MEEESGALEVDDAGAESSDSPPEVSTLLSHFCSPKIFRTFTNSPTFTLLHLQWPTRQSSDCPPEVSRLFFTLLITKKTFALSPKKNCTFTIKGETAFPTFTFFSFLLTQLVWLSCRCETVTLFHFHWPWTFRTFTFLLNHLRGKTINN